MPTLNPHKLQIEFKTMNDNPIILIADRNPHISNYLERELSFAGYQVYAVKKCRQLFHWINNRNLMDLLVLDPDFLKNGERDELAAMLVKHPELPVIVHGLSIDYDFSAMDLPRTIFVEKSGASVVTLKQIIQDLFRPRQETVKKNELQD
jgi:DNA-binding NtrC family response regulator